MEKLTVGTVKYAHTHTQISGEHISAHEWEFSVRGVLFPSPVNGDSPFVMATFNFG